MTLEAILTTLKHPKARAAYASTVRDVLPTAKLLCEGSERTAYTVGRWVVKKQNGRTTPPRHALRRVGVHPPTQWLINGWQVQPRYRRSGSLDMGLMVRLAECPLDLGVHNIGRDRWGRYVAFDW